MEAYKQETLLLAGLNRSMGIWVGFIEEVAKENLLNANKKINKIKSSKEYRLSR